MVLGPDVEVSLKRIVVSGAVVALAIGGAGVASAEKPTGFKVTGGGQIIADSQGGGAGDTVGFVAQQTAEGARGQFQYVPRGESTNDSAPDSKFHGVVTCLESTGTNSARFGGFVRDGQQAFTVDVTDNGQGGDSEDDLILVRFTGTPCADNPENDGEDAEELLRLGRGNVKVHNSPSGAPTPAGFAKANAALLMAAR